MQQAVARQQNIYVSTERACTVFQPLPRGEFGIFVEAAFAQVCGNVRVERDIGLAMVGWTPSVKEKIVHTVEVLRQPNSQSVRVSWITESGTGAINMPLIEGD